MKEILFKAKRLDNGEWVEGYYIGLQEGAFIIREAMLCGDNSVASLENEFFQVQYDTLCQYINLNDKHGNKIWENDIVKDSNIYLLGAVVWTNGGFYVDDIYDGIQDYMEFIGDTEVIGNIFDNPELLKSEF